MRQLITIILTSIVLACGGCAVLTDGGASGAAATDLRCEYLVDPLGIDVPKPRLSWVVKSKQRGQMQTAYQILVASSEENLAKNQGDLWDTGKVESDQSIHVAYEGKRLRSRMQCFWKVCVWDGSGKPGRYSRQARWEVGLLWAWDWQARWLSAPAPADESVQPSPLFRKTFVLEKPIKKARAYVCGLGYYELYLNGKKVGDNVLDPAFTHYDRRVLYVTYDVTKYVRPRSNAVGVMLGNGWYNMHTSAVWGFDQAPWRDRPTMLCQLEVEFTDGSSQIIASDSTWKVSTGPILFDSIRSGEKYDARLEKYGWNTAYYDDAEWEMADIVTGPQGELSAQTLDPIKVTKTIRPVRLIEPEPGRVIFDMGQNMAGWVQLRVSGPAGTEVVLKYSERLNEDGTLDREDIGRFIEEAPVQTDTYILKGGGMEIWEPRFVYHGFQYVEVTGLPQAPTLGTLQGRVVHTSFERAGDFQCSNKLFDKIQRNTLWSYISNFHGYPTDCPHREKNGWTGDAHLAAETGLYNFASAAAYTKWLNDFKDAQLDSGKLPGIVPTAGWGYTIKWMDDPNGFGPTWDSAYVLIPWYLYQYCGDTRILAEHYDRLKRYVDYLTDNASDHIVSIGLGDHAPAETETPVDILATGYYYTDAKIVSQVAAILGEDEDATKYAELAQNIKEAFNDEFFDPQTHLYANGSQTALSCALYHGLVEPDMRQKVLDNLISNIEEAGGHLDAGILGTKYLLNALTENGRADVAYTIASQRTFPSWGYWIDQGATTLWEQWSGQASRNHIMFGDISACFYKALAGINPDPNAVGFKRIIIRPLLLGDLKWVNGEHDSMYGRIESSWRRGNNRFSLVVTIPANTTATVYVPARDAANVTKGGRPASEANHVRFLRSEDGAVVFEVGSGRYRFESELP